MNTTTKYLLPILLLSACTGSQESSDSPPPLYGKPKTVALDTSGGYALNVVTGDSIQPVINSLGDTVKTGVPIAVKGKTIDAARAAKPKSYTVPPADQLTRKDAHPNVYALPKELTSIPVKHDALKKIPLATIDHSDTTHYLVNASGDTIPTGVPIPTKGKTVAAPQPAVLEAPPLTSQNAANIDMQYLDVGQGMTSSDVYSIFEDQSGNLWFATSSGVSKYDGQAFTHFTEKEGLSDNEVHSILEDQSGNLWFATRGGVSKYDGHSFTHFTQKEGLSSNEAYSILEDQKSSTGSGIWLSTRKGLSLITVEGASLDADYRDRAIAATRQEQNPIGPVITFGKQDGLKSWEFNFNSAFVDSKNRAWWGSRESLTMLDLNDFTIATQPPQPHLRYIDINEAFIDYRNITDNLQDEISFSGVQPFENYPLDLELAYDQNNLTFHFSAIDWAAPHKIKYSHLMEGLSRQWSAPSSEPQAAYRNLPYGTYTFKLKAIGESGQWSEPFQYTFTIHPPWWQTWWAYLLYALGLMGIVWQIIRYRSRALKKQNQLLEQKVEERTADLKSSQEKLIHAEKMASLGELTAGIAHEIKNPLNFVNNFSEVTTELVDELNEEIDKGDLEEVKSISQDIKQNLEKIAHHGKRADGIVKSMLEHSRSGAGEKTSTDLNKLTEEYLNLAYHGYRAKESSFNPEIISHFAADLPKALIVPQDIGRVLLNLINNALYAVAKKAAAGSDGDYQPTVTVTTKAQADQIQITVTDNGPGIPPDIRDKIFQPFFTTKPAGQGTGLGLSLSYDIRVVLK